MSFSPGGGGGISAATDVFFNTPVTGNYLGYNTSNQKWENRTLTGYAALSTGGGQESVVTNAAASGATTLNLANGNVFDVTLTGNVTFAFSGATAGRACAFTLYKRQDTTGNRTTTWPGSVRWSGGAPSLTAAASSIDILVFESIDGGATWFGSLVGTNFS